MASDCLSDRERISIVYAILGVDYHCYQISADEDDPILSAAKELATILRAKKAYTNTATFDIKCEVSRHFYRMACTTDN